MKRIDIDDAIRLHTKWRRQFLNAFADGDYAHMPLSEHRGCALDKAIQNIQGSGFDAASFIQLVAFHERFHALANDIVELSNNGLGDSADLLLPELNEASHQLVGQLDKLREFLSA
jgi:superfamily II DNA/RNA helicase